ncbi:hypothetical protein ACRDNQ_03965 [Palleronia sp. KMU-117]|uniref:hypothetical protein n=1 Tax=Palleronia sp. KMU-117 TaxID=3434108 RepID=UPI003D702E26
MSTCIPIFVPGARPFSKSATPFSPSTGRIFGEYCGEPVYDFFTFMDNTPYSFMDGSEYYPQGG